MISLTKKFSVESPSRPVRKWDPFYGRGEQLSKAHMAFMHMVRVEERPKRKNKIVSLLLSSLLVNTEITNEQKRMICTVSSMIRESSFHMDENRDGLHRRGRTQLEERRRIRNAGLYMNQFIPIKLIPPFE